MTNPSSGTTSEMHHHHRESSANAAQAGSEPEQQQRLIEDPAAYLGSRSRKTSADDYPSNNLSNPAGVPNPKEDAAAGAMGSAQETRPRTTTLSSMSESEAAASVRASSSSSSSTSSITSTAANTAAIPTSAPTSHFYGPFAASGDPAAPSTDLDSEPSTPLAAAAAAAPTAPSACERDEASSAAQPGLHREHRPAPLQLSQKFHSTSQVHVASARQTAHHAGTRTGAKPSSPLRQSQSPSVPLHSFSSFCLTPSDFSPNMVCTSTFFHRAQRRPGCSNDSSSSSSTSTESPASTVSCVGLV